MAMPDLGKQIGPLPLGAWIVVVGGGLGIAYYTKNFGKQDPVIDTSATGADPSVGNGSVGSWVQTEPPGTPTDSQPQIVTNDDWGRAATNYLIAQGYDPAMADQAIRDYLSGSALSVQERALVTLALGHLGAPPVPLPPGPVLPPIPKPHLPPPKNPGPAPPPKPHPKPHVRYYTVVRGDNLWNIAKRYYKNPLKWTTIYTANRKGHRRSDGTLGMISNPNLILPGWRLVIP